MLPSGAVLFILIVSVLLAASVAWIVAALYERRMLALMTHGAAPEASTNTSSTVQAARAAAWGSGVDLAANRRATFRLMAALGGISLLIALTQSALALFFVYDDRTLSVNRLLVLGAIYAWPMVLAWGLARRWSWRRILGGVALYMLVMLALVMLRSTENQSFASVSGWLFSQVAVPMSITLLIGASGRIRAVAPYLLPPALLLTSASVLSLQIMMQDAQYPPAWVVAVVNTIGAYPTLLLFALGPWLLLAWPIVRLGRTLAETYRRKRFSDLTYLIAAYWFLILFASSLPAMERVGWIGFVELLAWLWLPCTMFWLRGYLAPPPGPPTLLVLRVFQRDAEVERLFDQVIERWRLTGNTLLIAGTDVLSGTLDPDDLFVYLNGSLAERFIAHRGQIAERIAGFDMRPDPDGRYRINECYCFDSTWQPALRELVRQSDVVLMDLRGFRPENSGCRYELGVLAAAADLRRVVILFDSSTARPVAEADIGPDADALTRFEWLATDRLNSATTGRVMAALFGAAR
jgi:hypothetical protein